MRIGIDIGGSHLAVGLISEDGKILLKKEQDILQVYKQERRVQSFIFENIVQDIHSLLEESGLSLPFIHQIGVATPGNFQDGCIKNAVNLGIEEWDITSKLQKEFPVKIVGNNDVTCSTIAEMEYGSLKDYEDAVFLTIGTGIGGGYIYQRKLVLPKENPGFEFGHMIIQKEGRPCMCGKRGCLEAYASVKRFRQSVREILQLDETTRGVQLVEIVKQALGEGKNKITCLVEEYIENLAIGLSNIFNLLEPEVICIGGSFIYYEEIFLERLKQEIKPLLFNRREEVPIILASLKNDAGMIGASMLE